MRLSRWLRALGLHAVVWLALLAAIWLGLPLVWHAVVPAASPGVTSQPNGEALVALTILVPAIAPAIVGRLGETGS